ncbi:putative Sacsin [Glarea lozoyensis 74030]|uniref:Putative Sacsin n=1 Tax=Glarea lozoyensis (strain ATCC 74030 / MF5533) TaxID=1104152 RepID=H0EF91_GLAL7|nr:putative Sacsin [Glarea lozoyensis 74030]
MIPVEDISYPNSGTRRFVSDKPLTHPDIPQSISEKLKIAKLTDRIRDEELEISDEYEQQEDMTTSIVRTLESYVIGSTFNEYLANADDTTTATVINWLLDTRTHPQEGLYHDDLKAAQGPALLVHNDDEKVSEALAPLLLTLQVKLVRRLPEYVSKQLRKIDGAQFVDGSFIRRLSKTTEFRTALEDGTLGTLRVGDQISEAKDYFLAPAKTQKLFKFASSLMVSESYDKAFRYVLKARTSNLKALELCYVDELMELRPEPKAVSKQEDNWLRDFWKFWDSNLDTSEDVELDHFGNVLKSRTGDVESYRRLSEMDTLPAIIEPTEEEHLALIRKIPGLVCFDRTIMPKSLKDSSSLHESKDSISRLFKAFHELATSSYEI